ncbi:hypothetical protein IAR55_005473 [Kwoniella newhampshirensis]|uniref:Auxin efflux carrier n=1 Tax=Kwoniella newhampshirensis TaxID=1651941 RepID=A0AAW0YMC0_9TREE
MTSTTGQIIYKAFAPTIKMMICIAIGYFLTKRGVFAPANGKGVSILSLNVGLPALIFSSMVSAFTPENIKAFGPLVLVAIIYTIAGWVLAFLIRDLFYVPADFQYGIFVMGAISNWGNLPTAVVQTLAKSPPFDPNTDVELGIAYIAPTKREVIVAEKATQPDSSTDSSADSGDKRLSSTASDHGEHGEGPSDLNYRARPAGRGTDIIRKKSRASSYTEMMETTRPIPSTTPLEASNIAEPCISSPVTQQNQLLPVCSNHGETYKYHHPTTPEPSIRQPSLMRRIINIIRGFFMPLTVAIILGIICSVIQPIKALFVVVDGFSGSRIPYAPDGNPPLSFIQDTATFLGGMTIPAGMILMGASFARLRIPKKWSDMPIAAMIALRDQTKLIPRDDKMRIFVSILLSGTPASVNQLVITQLYNPEGTADTLSAFLVLQYIMMPILSTALAAIALFIAEQ